MTTNNAMISFNEAQQIATNFVKSGLFKDTTDIAKATVKILAGAEFGIGPFAAMKGINIIQGSPAVGANLIASKIKTFGRYDYRVVRQNDLLCHLEIFDKGQSIGNSVFTMDDAQKAGLLSKDIWRKYPRNMLFARAVSNAHRWFCPEIFGGTPVYTPEELDAPLEEWEEKDITPIIEEPIEVKTSAEYREKIMQALARRGVDTQATFAHYNHMNIMDFSEAEIKELIELGKKLKEKEEAAVAQQQALAESLVL